jgi:hypothetical protein
MTMHLEGPWLSTTGKKRGKQKWASAEAKRKSELLKEEWEQRLGTFKKMAPRFSTRAVEPKRTGTLTVKNTTPPGRETPYIESRDTGWVPCVKVRDNEYTGTKCLGVSVLHKSNGVPVFSQEEVVEISKMRR